MDGKIENDSSDSRVKKRKGNDSIISSCFAFQFAEDRGESFRDHYHSLGQTHDRDRLSVVRDQADACIRERRYHALSICEERKVASGSDGQGTERALHDSVSTLFSCRSQNEYYVRPYLKLSSI